MSGGDTYPWEFTPSPMNTEPSVRITSKTPLTSDSKSDGEAFSIKDSGVRLEFESGMVRDTEDDKVDFTNVLHGPMFWRWAEHLTKAKAKYPDVAPGVPNWTKASGLEELYRFRRSAMRHFIQWLYGDRDEDHAAAVFFNINGAEYCKEQLDEV